MRLSPAVDWYVCPTTATSAPVHPNLRLSAPNHPLLIDTVAVPLPLLPEGVFSSMPARLLFELDAGIIASTIISCISFFLALITVVMLLIDVLKCDIASLAEILHGI
jgi:hypothetical protein